ncbi:MAG: amidohydrolase family protein [Acidobacteriales bacterium]|nr:amidohydrolase family protein [Terriglobales bacterium]
MKIDAYCTLGSDREYELTEASLLEAMDQTGVERAVIVPVDRFLAVNNREGNKAMRKAAASHPDRFLPACSVNPWYGAEAAEELRRAVGGGARVFVLHPLVQGFLANDELVFPVLDTAAHERVPVYVHTGPPASSTPWQIVDLATRYPELDFIMGHSGATDFWNDVVAAALAAPNIYIESSLARPFNFAGYMNQMDKRRGIMGSWAPLNDMALEWEQMRKALPPTEWEGLYGENLLSLLCKRGSL